MFFFYWQYPWRKWLPRLNYKLKHKVIRHLFPWDSVCSEKWKIILLFLWPMTFRVDCHNVMQSHTAWFTRLWILKIVLFFFCFFLLLQCRLRCCPGQKCGHQEAEQTLPEPDPCQEGIPGTGAHEMCQSQKCKWLSRGGERGRKTGKMHPLSEWRSFNPASVYFRFSINPFATKQRRATAMLWPC